MESAALPSSNPESAPKQRQQDALSQELADNPQTPGAQRKAQGNLFTPRSGPRQQQIRNVRAGDQQNDANGRKQNDEPVAHVAR